MIDPAMTRMDEPPAMFLLGIRQRFRAGGMWASFKPYMYNGRHKQLQLPPVRLGALIHVQLNQNLN
jgi:hypothetical protein